jgi:hypothetical protein
LTVTTPLGTATAAELATPQPRPATAAEIEAMDKADAAAAEVKKPRGRPRKTGAENAAAPAPTVKTEEGVAVTTQPLVPVDPQPATQIADTATATAGSTAVKTSDPVAAQPETSAVTESISKGDIVQILTGLQKKLEESATSIEEKRNAAQKCRDLIKSVVGSDSLKDAKPEHFGRIKSAVLKVLNNE